MTSKKTTLVCGAGGFIGSHIVEGSFFDVNIGEIGSLFDRHGQRLL